MPSYFGGTAQRTDPKFLIERLMRNGYSRMHAAAIVGNLQRESGLISNNVNKDEGAYGLMQWRGSRFDDLQKFAAKQGVPWTDPGTQADFIAHEMGGKERKSSRGFMAAKTIDEASAALKPMIRYGDQSLPQRQMFARNVFGAADPGSPEASAALPAPAPQPAGAQPAVSRETQPLAYADPYDRYRAPARGMRGGIASLGDMGAAYIARERRNALGAAAGLGGAPGQPPRISGGIPPDDLSRRIVTGLAQREPAAQSSAPYTAQSSAPPGAAPVNRLDLAAQITGAQDPRLAGSYTEPATGNQMLTGAPGRYEQGDVLNLGRPSAAPPGAPEPPRFPGGVPVPRARPMTGPGTMQGDPLDPRQTVAELGGLVDPMRYDYG